MLSSFKRSLTDKCTKDKNPSDSIESVSFKYLNIKCNGKMLCKYLHLVHAGSPNYQKAFGYIEYVLGLVYICNIAAAVPR